MKRLVLLLAVALSGCVTPYQSSGFLGGYSDTQLGENVFRVSFRGNGYTSLDRASDYALLHASDVTLSHGFRYFVIQGASERMNQETYTTPTQTTGSVYSYGNSASFDATTTGGETKTVSKPSSRYIITCYKNKPNVAGMVFDAKFLSHSLRGKYGIK